MQDQRAEQAGQAVAHLPDEPCGPPGAGLREPVLLRNREEHLTVLGRHGLCLRLRLQDLGLHPEVAEHQHGDVLAELLRRADYLKL